MFVTKEILLKYDACGVGLKWFERHFPDGAELIDVINHPKIDRHSLHWGYTNLSTTAAEQEAYRKRLNIDKNEQVETIYQSDNVTDSMFVSRSSRVEKSFFVFGSEDVVDSENVSSSKMVHRSERIYNSDFIYDSERVLDGRNVNHSIGIVSGNYIINSQNVMNAANVIESQYVIDIVPDGTKNIKNSAFINHCSDLDHCLFCHGIEGGEYLLFNKKISPQEYEMIKMQMDGMLRGHCLELVKYNEWPGYQVPLDLPIINRNIAEQFQELPEAFWRWVKTLPGYDPMIMYGITMQGNLLK